MLSSFHCGPEAEGDCRDSAESLWLKTVAMLMIFFASAFGVALPLIGKNTTFLRADGTLFCIAKPMAAGVVLATGFVHILPDALEALTSQCLPEFPWRRFPCAGFISMLAALGTLLIEFVGTEFYERKHINQKEKDIVNSLQSKTTEDILISLLENKQTLENNEHGRKENMHKVGIQAQAAADGDNHLGGDSCVDGTLHNVHRQQLNHRHQTALDKHELENVRHVVISQVMRLYSISVFLR
ncbi:hypothetical protein O6H91_07G091800 [Diphasiastrum complanatum]|uniref:Uncharacterized protein n=1 Tax=Diphasiastrum complanatum TaxID=34168 RepID=A0ACC2D8L9_DIPCM|nr:hypothetical protein O6H91_07G091800 [Diphasiastrum complanatum]